jgi:hypothetical protein
MGYKPILGPQMSSWKNNPFFNQVMLHIHVRVKWDEKRVRDAMDHRQCYAVNRLGHFRLAKHSMRGCMKTGAVINHSV